MATPKFLTFVKQFYCFGPSSFAVSNASQITLFTKVLHKNNFLSLFSFCIDLRTNEESNSAVKKVANNLRNLANIEKMNFKYLFCPPVFVRIDMSGDRTFNKVSFWYKASL